MSHNSSRTLKATGGEPAKFTDQMGSKQRMGIKNKHVPLSTFITSNFDTPDKDFNLFV